MQKDHSVPDRQKGSSLSTLLWLSQYSGVLNSASP